MRKMAHAALHWGVGKEADGGIRPGWSEGEELSTREAEAVLEGLARAYSPVGPETLGSCAGDGQEGETNGAASDRESSRRIVERRLRNAEVRYRTLVEQLPVVTFMAALDGGVNDLYISPQIETLLGYTQQEWLEDPVLWFSRLHPDDRERWHAEFARTCAAGERFRSEYRFVARDGRIVWVHGEAQVVRDEAGRPLFLQGLAFDITERKRAEETLHRAHEALEERVRDRTAELAAANETLRKEIEDRKRAEEELARRKSWRRWAGWRAAWPTTSTTCSPSSPATAN